MPKIKCPTCKGSGKVWEYKAIKDPDGKIGEARKQVKCKPCKGSGKLNF